MFLGLSYQTQALSSFWVFSGSSIKGQGQANWHISLNPLADNAYQSIQGSIALEIMTFSASVNTTPPFIHTSGAGSGLDAGFYFGWNAPKSEAWVIQGANPRYQFNMNALPNRLSGMYGFVQVKDSRNFYLFSGGYEVFAGMGGFLFSSASMTWAHHTLLPCYPYILLLVLAYAHLRT